MSTSTIGSTNLVSYLQSILQRGTSGGGTNGVSDPLASLFNVCVGVNSDQSSSTASSGNTSSSTSGAGGGGTWWTALDPNTLDALISAQGKQTNTGNGTSSLQTLFTKFDANNDGQISQTEFENAIGPNADKSQVDALFQRIDANGDGSISQDELASAINTAQSHSRHHHHHHHMSGDTTSSSGSGQGGLGDLLSAAGANGATTQTTNNADGTSTTIITYADGSTVSMTTPAASTDSSTTNGANGQNSDAVSTDNFLERLIKLQSQLLDQSVNKTSVVA